MKYFEIKSVRALEKLKEEKNLQLYNAIFPSSRPGDEKRFYQVYRDDEGNLYLFDTKRERQARLIAHSQRANPRTTEFHNKNTIEGRRDSVSLAIENILNSFANDLDDVDSRILQSRYPQEKLKSFLAKTITDEVELEAEFMKELITLTGSVSQTYDNEAELLKKVLANEQIASNPTENNLKKAFEMRLFKIENQEKREDEADEADEASIS